MKTVPSFTIVLAGSLLASAHISANVSQVAPAASAAASASTEASAAASSLPTRAEFALEGNVQQGGVLRGIAPSGAQGLSLNGEPVALADDGAFIVAFGRDFSGPATLSATLADGRTVAEQLRVAPTEWRISHVNASPRGGVSSEAFRRRRAPELERIVAAREIRSQTEGWRQDFIWPVTGRISGVFGSQRIYRGTPGSYHSGVDVARPTGTPVVAPADGVVVLAADAPFTLEGNLLMIDHGMGLNSAFPAPFTDRRRRGRPDRARAADRCRRLDRQGDRPAPPLEHEMGDRAHRPEAARRTDVARRRAIRRGVRGSAAFHRFPHGNCRVRARRIITEWPTCGSRDNWSRVSI